MDALIVDTDVVSYVFKRDTRSALYRPHLVDRTLLISFMTVAELEWWVRWRNWGSRRRAALEEHLQRYTVIDSDRALCRQWAEVYYQARQAGRVITPADAWIAATALLYRLPLVTHNHAHFDWISKLTVISEAQ